MITPIYHLHDEVGSTNDIALDMARSGAPEGTVVMARSQTKGRGRRGRSWYAKPGESVIVSVVLRPDLPANRLAFAAGVAVAECLMQVCGLDATLKWPNDVLINERKISGILVEATQGAAVVGIGVNVKQTEFTPELEETATSVMREGGSWAEVSRIAEGIVDRLFATHQLSFEEILTRWRKYMWGLGRSVEVTAECETVSGTIAGVDSDGALLIDQDGGVRRIVAADAISVLRQ